MSLADRLNSALRRADLQPAAIPEETVEVVVEAEIAQPVDHIQMNLHVESPAYKTLKEGLKSAHKHSPDEFGTTVIVVEKIGSKIQLPMKAGKYIVDDIQKKPDGHYEVHLVSSQK